MPLRAKKGRRSASNMTALLHELESSDDDGSSDDAGPSATQTDPTKPWLREFHQYLNTTDELSDGQTIVKWWGLNAHRYPVWASLARDHLAIMASSVSSERAFSSAGITISKRRNCLKGDVVEALQFLKCLIRRELVFRAGPSVSPEGDEDEDEDIMTTQGLKARVFRCNYY
ncbi:hypothetical protein PILCRDRAFT_10890 [Piloderma croceum F 1598]|uniref:HAT C-terminal dimerisation domain-containing protein n=1 Tax=Piloderma croceum (strain F 1598) TaxID=765440 RepID=A0A0C3EZN8_PILCF|nr:hypothetical protein PILCRDRAFT_15480 [Piloderma croceum F 1598]KIM78973.1 hypothetical protein PILCRDRAFT_10890 [Piloderma croceum F 1598]